MSGFQTIGKSIGRKEGLPKVTGKAVYTDDVEIKDCLYGKTVRSTVPHGYIKSISFREGIPWNEFTIVLPPDIPGLNAVIFIDTEQPFLARREIQHIAEPVALLAHPDKHLVERAVGYVDVEVEELPAIFTMEEALARNDIFKSIAIENGDPSSKWAEADVIVEETYRTGAQEHLYIEPNAVIATAVPGEHVTVMGCG